MGKIFFPCKILIPALGFDRIQERASIVLTTYESDVVMIHKGLSVKVAGCLIEIERDDENKTARVVASEVPQSSLALEAVKVQAALLRERAQRFLGNDWTVKAWIASEKLKRAVG